MAGITRLNVNARMNRRRVLAASGGAVLGATVLGNLSLAAAQDSDVTVTMVTDTAGVGDQNFNDLAVLGGNRAAEELGVEFNILESQTQADYSPNLALGGESSDLTIAVGALLGDAVAEVAPQFPDKSFALLDGVVEQDNVYSVVFREHEGGYLGGVLAALTSQSGILGVVGGIRVPPVARYEVGFMAGARTINPDIEVLISYADSFEDPALGQELTLAQFNNGADVVLPIAGRTGVGSFDAVNELGEGYWIIAADTDQSHLGPGRQLAALKKGVDVAFFDATHAVVEGTFPGGTVDELGVAEGGIDIYAFDANVEQSILDTVAAYKQAIIDGVIVPPATDEELVAFEPTPLDGAATPSATPAS
ncbi:MAG: BMP family ABC transporter substrate-binding protein [Chloroflexota bacterium]|nr:BMP family ABC transporter substrate-binding protein [Chloroflexota bacterium]